MRPSKIFIVRHGESEGNIDKSVYGTKPDYAVRLTPKGIEQSFEAGKCLVSRMVDNGEGKKNCIIYHSPYIRAIETTNHIIRGMKPDVVLTRDMVIEEPRLREQEWHSTTPLSDYTKQAESDRVGYGIFHYQFPFGESCAHVFDRLCGYVTDMGLSFQQSSKFPPNLIIVTHGMTMRVLLMKIFGKTVSEFETWRNPHNCQILELTKEKVHYHFDFETLRKRPLAHEHSLQIEV